MGAKKKAKPKDVSVSLRIPSELAEEIRDLADLTDDTASRIFRVALREYLDQMKAARMKAAKKQ